MPRKKICVIAGCLFFFLGSFSGGASCRADDRITHWIHSFYFENDLFNGTDSNYTNGVKYSLISPDLSPGASEGRIPRAILEYIHKIPFISKSGPSFQHRAEFSFGQNMYTPADISRAELIRDDRPYAGWTYVGLGYHRRVEPEDNFHFLDTVEVQIGMIGPQSYAEETQKMVHGLRHLQRPNGWDNQLVNEPGLNVAFERKWLIHAGPTPLPLSADLIPHLGASVGNVSTYLNAGLELRIGWKMASTFGVSLIRPAGSTRMTANRDFNFYIFGATNSKVVFRDIFLDGNTFAHSHSVDRKDVVADFAAGLAMGWRNVMLTLTEVRRSKEFDGQRGEHSFGSVNLTYFH